MAGINESLRRVVAFGRATLDSIPQTSRSLRRAPGFVAIAAISLGAALGISTSVFALIDSMRHPESPFRSVDQLYVVWVFGTPHEGPSAADIETALRSVNGVTGVANARSQSQDIEMSEGVERGTVVYARRSFFTLLEFAPRRGRLPTAEDAARGNVALVSDAIWRRKFNDRVHVDGATLAIEGRTFDIIGVLPTGADRVGFNSPEVWIPEPDAAAVAAGTPFIRVERGSADTANVQTQLKAVTQRWTSMYSRPGDRPFAMRLVSLRPDPLALKDFHWAMIGAAICVLLIACANVSALMLARGMVRRRDYALRLALGAGRAEIAREVIVEVAALAVVGCVAGAVIATWAIGIITRATPVEMHWQGFVQPQWSIRVLALSGLAVLVSVAIAGGFPAWQASRSDPMVPLKEGSGGTTGRAGTRFRWLVVSELALSMTLVMGASLMLKSANKMAAYDFGYDARGLLSVDIFLWYRDSTGAAERAKAYDQLLQRVKSLPGVESAASYAQCGFKYNVVTSDRSLEGGATAYVPNACVVGSAGLFRTLGIPMADGRDFIDGDNLKDGAVILDERTAHRLFPHERAIGRMVKLGDVRDTLPWIPVVGVVKDRDLAFNFFPEMGRDTSSRVYAAIPLMSHVFGDLIIRPKRGARGIEIGVSRAIHATLPPRSWSHIQPWVKSYQDALLQEQFLTLLFSMLGFASLALGAAGLFSVISYIAGQRNREFAVRIALGATNANVLRLVMKDALMMSLGGTAAGAGLGMWAGFLLWDKMWGVYPVDAGALIAGETMLLVVTMMACLLPALRATKANPVDVLRAA